MAERWAQALDMALALGLSVCAHGGVRRTHGLGCVHNVLHLVLRERCECSAWQAQQLAREDHDLRAQLLCVRVALPLATRQCRHGPEQGV